MAHQLTKSAQQLQRLFGLLKTHQVDREGRAQLVYQFTNERSTSCADLSFDEADAMIKALAARNYKLPGEAMRRKIISMAHEMGWERSPYKIDMDRVYAWVEKYGYLHKPLNQYTPHELPKLVTQFEGVHKHYLSKRGK